MYAEVSHSPLNSWSSEVHRQGEDLLVDIKWPNGDPVRLLMLRNGTVPKSSCIIAVLEDSEDCAVVKIANPTRSETYASVTAEGEALRSLALHGVVELLDMGTIKIHMGDSLKELPFVATRQMACDLYDLEQSGATIEADEIARLARTLFDMCTEATHLGLAHTDLTPINILCQRQESNLSFKVGDFGSVVRIGSAQSRKPSRGAWMQPYDEQVTDMWDPYAVGSIIEWLLCETIQWPGRFDPSVARLRSTIPPSRQIRALMGIVAELKVECLRRRKFGWQLLGDFVDQTN
jgi:hypothetical protein